MALLALILSFTSNGYGNYNENKVNGQEESMNSSNCTSQVPSGFYIGVDLGYNTVLNVHSVRKIVGHGGSGVVYKGNGSFVYAFNAGYQHENYRIEVLGSLLNSRVEYSGNTHYMRDWSIMARGLYDFSTCWTGFFPYLGLQLGDYTCNPQNPNVFGVQVPIQKGSAFAYGPIFGLRYNIIAGLYIHGEWNSITTLAITKNDYSFRVNTNTFLGGLKYRF